MFNTLLETMMKVTEAVAVELSPEKKMKKFYKNRLNRKLKPSTYAGEDWIKFWLLSDGTIIPVDYSHELTCNEAGLGEEGAFAGSIKLDQAILSVTNWYKISLTQKQIAKLRQLYSQYKPTELVVDLKRTPKSKSFRSPINSVAELEYRLEYGLDESVNEIRSFGVIEAGWIHPNGEREELKNYSMRDHDIDAYHKMHPDKDIPENIGYVSFPEEYYGYLSQGHIRYIQSNRGFNVELAVKPTSSQMKVIRKGIKESEDDKFYFSFLRSNRHEKEGDSWSEFVKITQKLK